MTFGNMCKQLAKEPGIRARASGWPMSTWLEVKDKSLVIRKPTGDYDNLHVTTGEIENNTWELTEK